MVAVRHAVRLPAMTRDVLAPHAEHNAITHSTVVITETIYRPVPAALSGHPGASGARLSRTGTAVQINQFVAALDGAHSGPWLRTYGRSAAPVASAVSEVHVGRRTPNYGWWVSLAGEPMAGSEMAAVLGQVCGARSGTSHCLILAHVNKYFYRLMPIRYATPYERVSPGPGGRSH
jgi:hypothetical protein